MCRKWKKTAALGLAVLIGGMMPMSTMLAAEENTEVVQEIEADSGSDAEVISDENGNVDEEEIVVEENAGDENIIDEANADGENAGEEVNADGENAADEVDADDVTVDEEADTVNEQNVGIMVMSASDAAEAGNAEVQENTDAPVIDIKFDGQSSCYALGGTINYVYVNNLGKSFECSVKQNDQAIAFFYYLDEAEKVTDPAKEEGQLENVKWDRWSESYELTMGLAREVNYVLYVKVEKDGQTTYARSGGVVVDTTDPEIIGVEEGRTYPAGTTFTVSDANLSEVLINQEKAEPEKDGTYKVAAQKDSTSCVIVAIDKAGRRTTRSITVIDGDTEEDPTENTVISESKVYALKAGVKYHLAAGNWKIDGDKSVYKGDSDFYVKEDGDYKFFK